MRKVVVAMLTTCFTLASSAEAEEGRLLLSEFDVSYMERHIPNERLQRQFTGVPVSFDQCLNYQVLVSSIYRIVVSVANVPLPQQVLQIDPRLPQGIVRALPSGCHDKARAGGSRDELKSQVVGFVVRGVTRGSLDWFGRHLPKNLSIDGDIDFPRGGTLEVTYSF